MIADDQIDGGRLPFERTADHRPRKKVFCIGRQKCNRLPISGDSRIELSHLFEGIAKNKVSLRNAGINGDGSAHQIDGHIISPDLMRDHAQKTHRIKMRPSVLKRMQILKVYRDVPIGQPTIQSDQSNQVDEAKAHGWIMQ